MLLDQLVYERKIATVEHRCQKEFEPMKSNSVEKKKNKKQKKLAVQVSNIFQNNNMADTFGEL